MNWKLLKLVNPRSLRAAGLVLLAAAATTAFASSAWAEDITPEQITEARLLFQKNATPMPCATCHKLADAQTFGAIGPDLDDLQPTHDMVMAVLRDGSGPMPSFEETLSEETRNMIANYVVWATSHDH